MNKIFKISLTAALVSIAFNTQAGINVINNESGKLSVDGNVELNFNFQNRESNSSNDNEFNQDGRVLIEFAGEKRTSNGHYVAVKAQPLFLTTGGFALDDAYFEFGKKNGWAIKAGRFESFDMFPVGLDVFLEYSGDISNGLYVDGAPYAYQMKEARGRGSDGQIMYHHTFGDLYVEVTAMLGDRSDLFDGGIGSTYHGKTIESAKDAFLVRPVVAYQMGDFRLAAAVETNLVSDAIVAEGIDISERTGYGLTGNWSRSDWTVNTSLAYLDAVGERNLSAGANVLWNNTGIGYVYSSNKYNSETSNWAHGNTSVSTVYASYAFRNALDIQDFSLLLGTYYSMVHNHLTQQSDAKAFNEHDDFGARVRLFYAF
ncbi:carbohydrate porin [Vibrio mimicus]|uniref:carbohydrate porin n=1 Tax=Vibrio mimicus TaxID=674 RepID=UPI0011D434BE|nr:carbohydrate porin [Vibrio mimicus]TXY05006.1 porin [Vibrio mimicus]